MRGDALNPFEMQTFAALGDDVDAVAIGRRHPRYDLTDLGLPYKLLPALNQSRVAVRASSSLPLPSRVSPSLDRLLGLGLATRGCHILHSAETALSITEQCLRLAEKRHSRVVLTCWENIPFRDDHDRTTRARKQRAIRLADRFIAITPSAANALIEEGAEPNRIEVIPAGVDCGRFAPEGPVAPLRAAFGIAESSALILYVGRLIQEKGVVELVRAFAHTGLPNAHLVLIGAGNQGDRLAHAARALGVAERVHVGSHVSYADLPSYLRAADVVAAPSLSTPYWQEQFGMVLVETLACGTPLITTDSGSITEVVGDAAVVVRDYDVGDLREALVRVLTLPRLTEDLRRSGRERALDHFDVGHVAKRIEGCYQTVLQSPRPIAASS